MRQFLALGLQASVVLILSGCSASAAAQLPSPSPSTQPTLTPAEQSQLTQLESRPLVLPTMPTDGVCPANSLTHISPYRTSPAPDPLYVYGSGPVYAEGGPQTGTADNFIADVTYFTAPTVRGVVLVRVQQLDRSLKSFFVGPWAAGPVVGTDTLAGKHVQLRAELVLPSDRPPANANAVSGWGIWSVHEGIATSTNGCDGIQFDTAAGSEVVVIQG
jgi:hypothetical protein